MGDSEHDRFQRRREEQLSPLAVFAALNLGTISLLIYLLLRWFR